MHYLQVLINPVVDKIEVQGKVLNLSGIKEKLFYFVLNKPKVGVLLLHSSLPATVSNLWLPNFTCCAQHHVLGI